MVRFAALTTPYAPGRARKATVKVPVSAACRRGLSSSGRLFASPWVQPELERQPSWTLPPRHMPTRFQLTLFVPQRTSVGIEDARRILDPLQHSLIAAHVTLCREDEFAYIPDLLERLRTLPLQDVELTFGPAESFDGHGLMLPCIGGAADNQSLRALVLGSPDARAASAHITLAHPRNPCAPGNHIETAHRLPSPLRVRFDSLSLIEQTDRSPWRTLWSLPLRAKG
jgi:hypothetical protein